MSLSQRFKRLSVIFSIIVTLVGLLVLIGWITDITLFKSILPHWISMKANAAICFLLAGIILILVNLDKQNRTTRWLTLIFSIFVFIIGTVTLLEYIFRFNAGIDELFFKDRTTEFKEIPPGRQSPFSAAYFMLFGFCYFPGIYERIRVSLFQLLHIISGIFVLAAAMSYLLGSYIIAGISLDFIFIIHSTIAFLFLIVAVLFSQPEKGYMKLVSSNTTGGKIIRKFLPAFLFIFVVIGWLGLRGEQTGLFNTVFSVSLLIILMIIIFSFILFSGAASLANSEVELTQSQKQLQLANENLDLAEFQAGLGTWIFDLQRNKLIWSKQIFRHFGLKPEKKAPSMDELIMLIHPDDRAIIEQAFNQMKKGIEPEKIEFRTHPPAGPMKYLFPYWQLEKDMSGKTVKFIGTLLDITERVEAREEIKRREEMFSNAFHSKAFGLAIVNKERRVVDINETLTSLLGYSREEFIGKTSIEIGLTDPEYIKKRDELLLILFANGKIEDYELDLVTRRGKPLSLLLSVEPLPLNGRPHWLIYLKDVTEKRKAAKALAESENRLRTILETVPECIKLIDTKGELVYMNPAGLAMIEAEEFEHIKGRKGLDTINRPYQKDFYKLITTVFSGTPGKMQYEITGLKGSHRWMETIIVPLRDAGEQIVSLLCVTRDISENKKTEEQIRSYNEQLRMLAANLQSIREEERKRIGREVHDELGQRLTILRMEIARMNNIKNNEKNFSEFIEEMLNQVDECIKSSRKISSDLRPPIIDDLGLISALEWQAEEFGKRTGIRSVFKTEINKLDLPSEYAIGVFRIFQESLTNIARHADATKVTSTLFLYKEELVLTIVDNGRGFNTETIGSKKTLGLIGMKERALLMNGSYDINSSPGMGTEIMVIIPLPAG
jgi:PAS domain S-box-containing protein